MPQLRRLTAAASPLRFPAHAPSIFLVGCRGLTLLIWVNNVTAFTAAHTTPPPAAPTPLTIRAERLPPRLRLLLAAGPAVLLLAAADAAAGHGLHSGGWVHRVHAGCCLCGAGVGRSSSPHVCCAGCCRRCCWTSWPAAGGAAAAQELGAGVAGAAFGDASSSGSCGCSRLQQLCQHGGPGQTAAARCTPRVKVYEKERRLRTMMKMHGLGDAAYWGIQVHAHTLRLHACMAAFVHGSIRACACMRVAERAHAWLHGQARAGRAAVASAWCAMQHMHRRQPSTISSPLPHACLQYGWFFLVNFVFTWILIIFGSIIRLNFFTKTDYSFQFVSGSLGGCGRSGAACRGTARVGWCAAHRVAHHGCMPCPGARRASRKSQAVVCLSCLSPRQVFYLLWINCLIAFSFLLSTLFRSSKTGGWAGGRVGRVDRCAHCPQLPLSASQPRLLIHPAALHHPPLPSRPPCSRDCGIPVCVWHRPGGLPAHPAVCGAAILVVSSSRCKRGARALGAVPAPDLPATPRKQPRSSAHCASHLPNPSVQGHLPRAGARLGAVPRAVRDQPVRVPGGTAGGWAYRRKREPPQQTWRRRQRRRKNVVV